VSSKQSERAFRTVAAALRQKIWDTLPLAGATRIFLVPDGALHLVPFGALPAGDAEYLVDKAPLLHLLSAERDLISAADDRTRQGFAFHRRTGVSTRSPRPTKLVSSVFRGMNCSGERRFQALPYAGTRTRGRFQHLEGFRTIGSRRAPHWSSGSEAAFKAESAGKRVLHLASHAFVSSSCGSVQT